MAVNCRTLLTVLATLSLVSCQQTPREAVPTLHEIMVGQVDPVADVIWKTASKSYGQDGNAATGLLKDADWARIGKAADELHAGAGAILVNPGLSATRPGVTILDEGKVSDAITSKQVQGYIDSDRPALASHARELASIASAIGAAARAHDAVRAVKLSEDLDEVCESCHKSFWYPDLPKPRGLAKPQ